MKREIGHPQTSASGPPRIDADDERVHGRRRTASVSSAIRRLFVAGVSAVLLGVAVSGCSSGDDAVAQGGTFEFVSPGGQVDIYYDPPQNRGSPGLIRGPDLMDPNRTVSVDDFAGQVVVINVWGQWCGPCRTEMPELQTVYDATRNAGVAFVGIDVRDNNRQAAVDFIVDRKVTFPSIYDPPMRTMIALGARYPTTVIPSTIVLDRSHRVAAVFLRALLAEDLEPVVRRLAAEPATDPGSPQ
ncbi:TlpA family protein disulfide reductase [Mycobacterium sp. 29Ha]|uniref:TlpA family protein disulfide reductase n=1 Tax=Mycobacterium sp. 29Ha TaxID=2939268 RepID=UPI003977A9BC